MRPQIPDALEEAIRETYEDAGYATETELVRDAIRQHVDRLQSGQFGVSKAFTTRGEQYSDGAIRFGENHHANYRQIQGDYVDDNGNAVNGFSFGAIGSGHLFCMKLFLHRAMAAHDDLHVVVVDPLGGFEEFERNVKSSQWIDVDTTTPLGLFNPVTDEEYLQDETFCAQAMARVHNKHDSVSKLEPVAMSLLNSTVDDNMDVLVESLREADDENTEDVANTIALTRPFIDGSYDRLQQPAQFDVTDERFTYLQAREGTEIAALLEAYRQGVAADNPVLIFLDEAHVGMFDDHPVFERLMCAADDKHVGLFGATQEINCIEPQHLSSITTWVDHTFGFRTEHLGDKQAFQLRIQSREREFFSSLLSGKNDIVNGAESLYRRSGGEWTPMIIKPSKEEMEIIHGDKRTEY